jgi:hypothetical protein
MSALVSIFGHRLERQVALRALLEAAATADKVEVRGDSGFGTTYALPFHLTTGKTSVHRWVS